MLGLRCWPDLRTVGRNRPDHSRGGVTAATTGVLGGLASFPAHRALRRKRLGAPVPPTGRIYVPCAGDAADADRAGVSGR
jgi:hypothetical protein